MSEQKTWHLEPVMLCSPWELGLTPGSEKFCSLLPAALPHGGRAGKADGGVQVGASTVVGGEGGAWCVF